MLYLIGAAVAIALLLHRIWAVRQVRYLRVSDCELKYAHLIKNPEKMTYQEANEIMHVSQLWDMPWLTTISLSFALFKTYAIPTISKVLCKSRELSDPANAARRAEDTAVTITEFLRGLDTERGAQALARMNYLHSRYGSLITNDDMLYTLSLFIFEPIAFAEKYDWRPMTLLEQESRYVFWREIGARMGIKNIPPTREALYLWKEGYAKENYKYSPDNRAVGDATFDVFLRAIPGPFKSFARQASIALLDDQTREAFGYERSPEWIYKFVPALLIARGWVVGYFLLPRLKTPKHIETEEIKNDKGEVTAFQRLGFLFEPWYVSPKVGPLGVFGYHFPGVPWHPEGYEPSRLGPERLRETGVEEVKKNAAEMIAKAKVCPFFAATTQ